MKKTIFKWLKRLGILVLIVFVGAEVYLRIKYYEQLKLETYPAIYQPDSTYGYTYIPGAVAEICTPSIEKTIRINSRGYTGPDFKVKKAAGTYRIAVVGVSQEAGIFLEDDSTFAVLMQKRFREEGYNVEVINCSVDGRYRDIQNIARVKHEVIKYRPDLVLLSTAMPFVESKLYREQYKDYVIIYSDAKYSRENCIRRIDYLTKHRVLTGIYNVSYVARAACRYYYTHYDDEDADRLKIFVRKRMQAPDVKFAPYASNWSANLILDLQDTLASVGSELLVFQYMPDDFYSRVAHKHCLPYTELYVPSEAEFVHDHDGHFNKKGHHLIAEQLYARLMHFNYCFPRVDGQ